MKFNSHMGELKPILQICFFVLLHFLFFPETSRSSTMEALRDQLKHQLSLEVKSLRQVFPPGFSTAQLEYIALEKYHNTPHRMQEAHKLDDLAAEYKRDSHLISIILQRPIQAIKISGKGTYYAWPEGEPAAGAIFKRVDAGPELEKRLVGLQMLLQFNKSNVEYVAERVLQTQTDVPLEGSREKFAIERATGSYKQNDGEIALPLHGFLNSHYFLEMAIKKNMSLFDFFKTFFIPKFADFFFKTRFLVGLLHGSHTQNLWIVLKPDGDFYLSLKDLQDTLLHPLFLTDHSKNRINPVLAMMALLTVPKANDVYIPDSPRAHEPSYNFTAYAFQTITLASDFDFKQRSQLLRSFFDDLIGRIEAHFGVRIKMSSESARIYELLGKASTQKELSASVPTGRLPGEKYVGLPAASEIIMRQIYAQIYRQYFFNQPRRNVSRRITGLLDMIFHRNVETTSIEPFGPLPWSHEYLEHPDRSLPQLHPEQELFHQRRIQNELEIQSVLRDNENRAVYQTDGKYIYFVDSMKGTIWQVLQIDTIKKNCLLLFNL